MKHKIAAMAAGFTLLMGLISGGFVYSQTYAVVGVDRVSDTVFIESAGGMVFAFEGVEDYDVGDLVSCIMWTSGTPEVFDDVIMSVRYSGTPEMFQQMDTYPEIGIVPN